MRLLILFRFAWRAWIPLFCWVLVLFGAGCSVESEALAPPAAAASSARTDGVPGTDPGRAAQAEPLPPDLAATAPPWLAPPQRPAFTPHWYTPSFDPLFRRQPPPAPLPAPTSPPPTRRRPAPSPVEPRYPKDFHLMEPYLEGIASWYGPRFHGKRTASGEIYNQYAMTAAHPTLPLGTVVRVENLVNGRVVWVRINDRGPYKKGRVLDLSRRAAERLEMVDKGTTPVRMSVLRWPDSVHNETELRPYTQYVVQVAAYPEPWKAEDVLESMRHRFAWTDFMLDPRPNGVLSIVVGPFDDRRAAARVAGRLRRSGVTSLVRRYRK